MNQGRVRPWHLANTTIRNPFRLKGGLEALIARGYEGHMGKEQEEEIAFALDDAEVISLSASTADVTSISRKWRSVLIKLGFIWPDAQMVAKRVGLTQDNLGAPFTLTPNGRRLLVANSLQAEQEVILRALAALQLPSPLEPAYNFSQFSPLRFVIRILDELDKSGHESYISRLEMASIVILSNGEDRLERIVELIATQRKRRSASVSKRRFDNLEIGAMAEKNGLGVPGTLFDYQDVTFRYLKATGLFQSRGRGITLVPEQRKVASLLASEADIEYSSNEYVVQLAKGADLPTDSYSGAATVLTDLRKVALEWGVQFDDALYDLTTPEGTSIARHDLEQLIFEAKEIKYAEAQPSQIGEILAYLELLDGNRGYIEFGEEQLKIPRDERPAYFEWVLWRVLLAMENLVVPPSEVRRFNVDQDFLPVSTASGGGADVIGEYEDSVLVVEVTLTENSRQEAAEGEPVRRHVADILERFEPLGKSVYGLFVAKRIDTNTAETFRIGVWYKRNDERINLNVVPITLRQLREMLGRGAATNNLSPSLLIDFVISASEIRLAAGGAPEWKSRIADLVMTDGYTLKLD